MTLLTIFYQVMTPLFVTAALGYWFGKRISGDPRPLSRAVVYVFAPCLILQGFLHLNLQATEVLRLGTLFIVLTLFTTTMGTLVVRSQRGVSQATQSAIMLSVVLNNSGNFGLPLIEFAYGKEATTIGVLVVVFSTIATNSLGVYFASRGQSTVRESLLTILRMPLPYAVVIGLVLRLGNISLPEPLEATVSLLGQAAIPIMLLLMGVQISKMSFRLGSLPPLRLLTLVTLVRLVLTPILLFALTGLLGMSGLLQKVAVVQLSMPTAVNAGLLATEFNSDPQFTTTAILVTTLCSALTLSVLLALLQG